MVNDYAGTEFPVSGKDYCKIEKKNNICIHVFYYENNLVYTVYISDQKVEDHIDLLLLTDKNKSNYDYIKDFNRFTCNKTECSTKTNFCKYCLQCFNRA